MTTCCHARYGDVARWDDEGGHVITHRPWADITPGDVVVSSRDGREYLVIPPSLVGMAVLLSSGSRDVTCVRFDPNSSVLVRESDLSEALIALSNTFPEGEIKVCR